MIRVYVGKRKGAKRPIYHLKWIDPATHRWRSKKSGTDIKRAQGDAVVLERELNAGTYTEINRIAWASFVEEIAGFLSGVHADEAKRALDEFCAVCSPASPSSVNTGMIRRYVTHVREKGNAVATVNKKLRYIRLAFRTAVSLGYAGKSPMDGWNWQKATTREIRILEPDEEAKLMASGKKLRGFKMEAFIRFALETWGRLSEITRLAWDDVRFEEACVYFRNTKSHEDRFIPISRQSALWSDLRKLQVQTLQDGGPFVSYRDKSNLQRKWTVIVEDAEIPHITVHDLRRTGITRALLSNMAPITVQRLAGHKDIKTTMRYYVKVSDQDLRDAVEKLRRSAVS